MVHEHARALIRDRLTRGLSPRPPPQDFAEQLLESARAAWRDAPSDRLVFLDRGLPNALGQCIEAGVLDHAAAQSILAAHPLDRRVFLFPAWEAIYVTDAERDHTFDHAVAVHDALHRACTSWGFDIVDVPEGTVAERADFVLARCAGSA